MRIRKIVLVSVTAMCLSQVGPIAGMAWGGGGCHRAGTETTDEAGTTVEMVDACFTPTILRVAPGDSVTFVNRDPMVHNVTANDWGHWDDLYEGDRFTVSFDEEGIFPFACTYHPGMSGAVVVGGGGTRDKAPVAVAATAADPPSGGADWLVPGILGVLIGLASGYALSRRRRRDPATAPVRA
jgi:plastocyanin